MKTKQELRKWAKEIRAELDMEILSKELAKKLSQTEEYKNVRNIMMFYPMKNEVDLRELLKDETKKFYLPKIASDNLVCCPYKYGEETCHSRFGTCEPISEPCKKSLIDMVIVPALAVDKNGYRLGYGGGFYDRFLTGMDCIKVVCIPKQLIVKSVFPETHDISMDLIIS